MTDKTLGEQIKELCKTFSEMKLSDKRKRERFVDTWNNYVEMGRTWEADAGRKTSAAIWRGFYGAVTITILSGLTIQECIEYINMWADKLTSYERYGQF